MRQHSQSQEKSIKPNSIAHQQYLDKIGFYLNKLLTDLDYQTKRKLVCLAGHYILKQKGHPDNMIQAFRKVKDFTQKNKIYWGLQLIDLLVKNSRTLNQQSHSSLETLFIGVFKQVKYDKNNQFITNLKLIWKTWTFIFQNKHIKNIKPKILSLCDIDLDDFQIEQQQKIKKFISEIDPQQATQKQDALQKLLESDSN